MLRRLPLWTLMSVLLLAAAIASSGCEQQQSVATPTKNYGPPHELTILTPHNETIREAFELGFWNWYVDNYDQRVRIHWIYRGTPQCVDYVQSIPELRAQGMRYAAPAIMFGGGIADHAKLAELGLSRSIQPSDALEDIPPEVQGLPPRDPENRWFATGLSSFGILYNSEGCNRRGIAPPATWADLADPRYYGWVAVADPRASGSHRECLMLILQHHGWEAGWQTVMRILANARALNARSGEALNQVQNSVSLATFAVNFDGLARAADSNDRLKYVDPPGATVLSPDIISVLTTAEESDLPVATAFVEYVLSDEGQALWAIDREHTKPYGETLYHFAIKPSVYETYDPEEWAVSQNPLEADFGMQVSSEDTIWQGRILRQIVAAACEGDNHVALQLTWRKLIDAGLPAEQLAELTAPLFDEQTARQHVDTWASASPAERDEMLHDWTRAFSDRYQRIQEMLRK